MCQKFWLSETEKVLELQINLTNRKDEIIKKASEAFLPMELYGEETELRGTQTYLDYDGVHFLINVYDYEKKLASLSAFPLTDPAIFYDFKLNERNEVVENYLIYNTLAYLIRNDVSLACITVNSSEISKIDVLKKFGFEVVSKSPNAMNDGLRDFLNSLGDDNY